jgi:hypothetical protein
LSHFQIFKLISAFLISPVFLHAASPETLTLPDDSVWHLPVMEIKGNHIFLPDGGINTVQAKKLVEQYLKDVWHTVDPNTWSVREITTKEIWNNLGVQLFCMDGLSWETRFFVISDKTILACISSEPEGSVFVSDLDSNGMYEIYTNTRVGFGETSHGICGYDLASNHAYNLNQRGKQDFHLYIDKGVLMTEIHPYSAGYESLARSGQVILKGFDDEKDLFYQF